MGYSAAPDIFHSYMSNLLAGITGVIVYLDDILIFPDSQESHDRILKDVLSMLWEKSITLNKDKVFFSKGWKGSF